MFVKLFVKDCKLLVKDLKFQLFTVLILALFIVGTISSGRNYKNYKKKFNKAFLDAQKYEYKKADHLDTFLTKGNISYFRELDSSFLIDSSNSLPYRISYPATHNKLWVYFSMYSGNNTLNWLFIIGVIGSFTALLFSYNAFSNEKRNGTMRLLTVSGISRLQILWSKVLSLLLLFSTALVLGILSSVLIWTVLVAALTSLFLFKLLIFLGLSTTYILIFILLGLLISTTSNINAAIVKTLSLWLFLIIIIPNLAEIAGKRLTKIYDYKTYTEKSNNAYNQEWRKWSKKYDDPITGINKVGGNMFLEEGYRAKAVNSAKKEEAKIRKEYIRQGINQIKFIERLSYISPFSLFKKTNEIIFDQGLDRFEREINQLKIRSEKCMNMMKDIDKEDDNSLHLFYSWAATDANSSQTLFTRKAFPKKSLLVSTNYTFPDWKEKLDSAKYPVLALLLINLVLIVILNFRLKRYDMR